MNILMLVHNTTGQGTYRRAYPFARELAKKGHTLTLLSTSPHNRLLRAVHVTQGVRLIESPDLFSGGLRSGWDLWNSLQRMQWIARERYDIVHAFDCRPTVIFPALLARWRGAKLVIDWADWFGSGGAVEERPNRWVRAVLRPIETFFEESFRPQADANTVICSTLYQKALALGVQPQRLIQVVNGCDTALIRPGDPAGSRRKLGLPAGGIWIGYVGTAFVGGARFLAQAFLHVQKRLPEAKLLWFGARPAATRRILAALPNTHIVGSVTDEQLNDYFAACNLFWLPLRDTPANWGRWPLKFNDFLSAGRSVVATQVGDVAEVIQREQVGWVTTDDPLAFADQTIAALKDEAACQARGLKARRLAEEEFSWAELSARLENLYQSL